MGLRHDCSALESIPLRLMIICVVASLSIVPAAEALETLKSRDYLRRVTLQLEQIVSAAEVVGVEGPGSARTISLDFTGGGSVRFQSLALGDRPGGPNSSSAVLTLSTGARIIRTASSPPTAIRSVQGSGLAMADSEAILRLSCQLENATWYVLVEVR